MFFTVRSSASPGAEPTAFQATAFITTGVELSARAEAPTGGSTLEISTGINLTVQASLLRPIIVGINFAATAATQVKVQTGLQMTVTAAEADFGFSRDLVNARQQDLVGETLSTFVAIGQLISDPTLRTVANGGRVQDVDANDIQFTTDAVAPLSHNIVTYGPTTGAFFYDLKLTAWAAVTADYRHRMFYGKSGVSSPIADPAGCFSGTAAVWSWPTGADISLHSRGLTATGITAGTLKGPAGVFAGTSSFARSTGPLFAALPAVSVEFWVRPTAIGRIIRIGPTSNGSTPGLDIRIESDGWGCTKTTSVGTQVSDTAASSTLGQDYHVVVVFASGVDNQIYINGSPVTMDHAGSAKAGSILVSLSDELAIGDPTPTDRTGFAGTLGRVFFWPIVLSDTWIKTSYRLQADQIAVVGIGAENIRGVTNRGPVAIPMTAGPVAATGTSFVDVDVAGRAFDANGNLLTATVPVAPTQGISSIQAGKVRYQPQGGSAASSPHTVPFQVADAALTSRSIIRVSVTAPASDAFLPTNFAAARASYTGTTYYVAPGETGGPSTNIGSPGNLLKTITQIDDGSRVILMPGGYPGMGSRPPGAQIEPKSGQTGRIQLRAFNPVFSDLDLTANGGKGALVGYDADAAHSFVTNNWELRFANMWIEGLRMGRSPSTNYGTIGTPTAAQVTMYEVVASSRFWYVKNFLKNTIQNGLVLEGPGKSVAYRNYCMCDSFDEVPADKGNWANDYFMFVDDRFNSEVYFTENIYRGGCNQGVSFKTQCVDGRVHSNIFDQSEQTQSSGAGTSLYLGQTSDKEGGPDNTIASVLVSNNRFYRIGGCAVHIGNIQDALVQDNQFTCTAPTDVVRIYTASNQPASINGPIFARDWTIRRNTFSNPGNSLALFGRSRTKETVQRTNVVIENNIASANISSRFISSSQQSFEPDGTSRPNLQNSARLRVRFGTNSKVDVPIHGGGLEIV